MVSNANSLRIGVCSHGSIWIELLDKHGFTFARAALNPQVALSISEELAECVARAASDGARDFPDTDCVKHL